MQLDDDKAWPYIVMALFLNIFEFYIFLPISGVGLTDSIYYCLYLFYHIVVFAVEGIGR